MARIMHVVGARPNLMKIAPVMEAVAENGRLEQRLVHTGQHYDHEMSQVFFDDLGLPRPDVYLGVGSASHAVQTARVMEAFEPKLLEYRPDLVVVVGDVNSTLACTVTAVKLHVPVAHVEAGLRSFNRKMPEEINRIVTDALSAYLFTTERGAGENLRREGIPEERIHFVGNVMIDTLLRHRERALPLDVLGAFGLEPGRFALLTLHRPGNVDDRDVLAGLCRALATVSEEVPVLFPVHPRTRKQIETFGLDAVFEKHPRLIRCRPLGYLAFLNAMANAQFVMTDSGGIQEETTVLGVPCLTLRPETERPVTVEQGTNLVIHNDGDRLVREARKILEGKGKKGRIPEGWDGGSARRIVEVLAARVG
jgi:UDP-N-acetylglucosamine 2-epimerase (non-hydrolysing)